MQMNDTERLLSAARRQNQALTNACLATSLKRDWREGLDGILDGAVLLADSAGFYTRAGVGGDVWLLTARRGDQRFSLPHSFRHGEGLVGMAAASRARQLSGPTEKLAAMATPVLVGEEVVGVLLLARDSPSALSHEETITMDALASLMAQLLRAAESERQRERLLAERSLIYRFSRDIVEARSEQGILDTAVPILAQLLAADAGLVCLLPRRADGAGAVGSVGTEQGTNARLGPLIDWWMATAAAAPGGRTTVASPDLPPGASLLPTTECPSSLLLRALYVKGQMAGVAGFQRALPIHGSYTDVEIDALEAMLGMLTTALNGLGAHEKNSSRAMGLDIASLELAMREERNRIAQEIHDGVAQNLALLLLKMEIISRLATTDPPRMRVELGKVMEILETSVQELRESVQALRSPGRSRRGPGDTDSTAP